jgi:hypothetical protein
MVHEDYHHSHISRYNHSKTLFTRYNTIDLANYRAPFWLVERLPRVRYELSVGWHVGGTSGQTSGASAVPIASTVPISVPLSIDGQGGNKQRNMRTGTAKNQ